MPSYGSLAREFGYGSPANPGEATIQWVEEGELYTLSEPQWVGFQEAFRVHPATHPGAMVRDADEAYMRRLLHTEPGRETFTKEEIGDQLDDISADGLTAMHALTARVLGTMFADQTVIAALTDGMWGQCSDIIRGMLRAAYNLDRDEADQLG